MTKDKEMKTIIQAIADFQRSAPIVLKTANNPFFKSKYADLPAVWHAIKDLMAENGLAVVNMNTIIDGAEYLETRVYHTGGEYLSSTSKLSPVKNDPQSVGSAITYMRRYALMSLLGLVADDDDDGNAASGKQDTKLKQQEKQSKPPEPVYTEEEKAIRAAAKTRLDPIFEAVKIAKDEKALDMVLSLQKKALESMPKDMSDWLYKQAELKRHSFLPSLMGG